MKLQLSIKEEVQAIIDNQVQLKQFLLFEATEAIFIWSIC